MAVAITIILVVLIICAFVTIWIYMYYCSENEIGMFADPRYKECIENLEKELKELK